MFARLEQVWRKVAHSARAALVCLAFLTAASAQTNNAYVLGPDDKLSVIVLDIEEIKGDKPIRVDSRGYIQLPAIGAAQVGGLTVEEAAAVLRERFRKVLRSPDVTVAVAEFRNQPVSVIGSVKLPGVQQIHGLLSLAEVLSLAGGLDELAGNVAKVTRAKSAGLLPLAGAQLDETGQFWVAEINVQSLLAGLSPASNIPVTAGDVIAIPKAEPIFVLGAVKKAGGFVLNERRDLSVLEALSLAEGLAPFASTKTARILRQQPGGSSRQEIPVDLKKLLDGRSPDPVLRPNDILYVPGSLWKAGAARAVEAMVFTATGITIYRVGIRNPNTTTAATAK